MHAAMERLDSGMPCGLIARFQGKTAADVEAAVETARRKFTVLERSLVWLGSRFALVGIAPSLRDARTAKISFNFKSEPNEPLWRYRVVEDGDDTWLTAIWTHAAADGPSMLRFVETISAAMTGFPSAHVQARPLRRVRRRTMAGWLMRFLVEQHLPYVRLTQECSHPAGVAWLTIPFDRSTKLLARARADCGSFAAWLAGAACMAFCDQQGVPAGRIMLNLPILRDDLARVGGFGFGVGSVLMPVKLDPNASLPTVARSVSRRLKFMIDQGWNENFERFLGRNPKRHLRFATLRTRGRSAPIVSVSWKGDQWQLGGDDGIRDLACFAVSTVAHVSGHVDRNGLSISVASIQSDSERADFLHRINDRLGNERTKCIYAFDGNTIRATSIGRGGLSPL